MRRVGAFMLVPLVLMIAACGRPDAGLPETAPSIDPSVVQGTLPAGWRWESYGGVEVGVPGDWGWGNGSQRLYQWCAGARHHVAAPMVGRPGVSTLVGCPGGKPDPATLIANTG